MKTYADLFTGFGGATIGAMAAGLTPLWGVEYRADVAAVANANLGGHVIVADVLECDPTTFAHVDVLHASPPCPNFSVAKAGGAETPHDIAMARKVAEFVTVIRPQVFTLENVMAYRDSQSWRIIEQALFDAGYWLAQDVVNSADYGVPQTRRRLIVRAVLGGFVPYLPERVPWVGWYAAIEDLLPTLPDSQLAPWQVARMPKEFTETLMINSENAGQEWGGIRSWSSQAMTMSTGSINPRAVLVSNGTYGDGMAQGADPAGTVTPQQVGRSRAVLVSKTADKFGDGQRTEHEPAQTIGANEHGSKAILTSGALGSNGTVWSNRNGDEPSPTVTTSHNNGDIKGVLPSRVVAMTPRCLARFQSFPDWYQLPAKRTLAALGIGNAVPPLMYQRILEGLVQS